MIFYIYVNLQYSYTYTEKSEIFWFDTSDMRT